MRDYAKSLPDIYREIMAAFPEIEPRRGAGYGLAIQTIAMHFANSGIPFSLGEIREAIFQLASRGFIEIRNDIFAHPTDLGEQLIAIVSGKQMATSSHVPALPPPPSW
jgi:hypothetical protein